MARHLSPDGKYCMYDQQLRGAAERLWNAWIDLRYAYADLCEDYVSDRVRLGIEAGIEKLRIVAQEVERMATSAPTAHAPLSDAPPALVEGVLRIAGRNADRHALERKGLA